MTDEPTGQVLDQSTLATDCTPQTALRHWLDSRSAGGVREYRSARGRPTWLRASWGFARRESTHSNSALDRHGADLLKGRDRVVAVDGAAGCPRRVTRA